MDTSANAAKKNALDTRERILDAAELLIIEHGYSSTSLRAIATHAEVNLAATHYHFGSKKGLLAAVFHRRVRPVNKLRLRLLNELIDSKRSLTVRLIVETFLAPFGRGEVHENIPGIAGRIFGEPESLRKPILEQEFTDVASQFLSALASVLPEVDREELRWRFQFMIGAMIHIIIQIQAPLGMEPSLENLQKGFQNLVDFCVAGIEQRTTS